MSSTYPELKRGPLRVYASAEQLDPDVGTEIGVSEWHTVNQARIDKFAEATGDFQWIHVDPARAADGPHGTTIAHGFLTLSLMPMLMAEVIDFDNAIMTVNYGLNRVPPPRPGA